MGEFICKIFSWPLVKFYELTGSYGISTDYDMHRCFITYCIFWTCSYYITDLGG